MGCTALQIEDHTNDLCAVLADANLPYELFVDLGGPFGDKRELRTEDIDIDPWRSPLA